MCNCKSILASTATVAIDSDTLLITPTVSLTPENEQGIKILLTNGIPATAANLPVFITLGGAKVILTDRFGNVVYGTQLYKGLVLKGYFGNNGIGGNAHYQLLKLPSRYYGD